MGLVEDFEKSQMTKDIPAISVGDTVIVHKVVSEGKKQRIQKTHTKNQYDNETFELKSLSEFCSCFFELFSNYQVMFTSVFFVLKTTNS